MLELAVLLFQRPEPLRKLPRQVDSSEVEFFPVSNCSRTQPGAGFPARRGVVLRCSFVATGTLFLALHRAM
jgi:hypothetical protein